MTKETVFQKFKDDMETSVVNLSKSFSRVRTGRASVALLDGIKVDYYGAATPIAQVANISVPESRQILIVPWDVSVITAIEKAIQKSDLGLTPSNDGKAVRLAIPQLTEERRKDIVKSVKKMAEEGKINLRNARRDANEELKSMKKGNQISEDELFTFQVEVQKLTDQYIEKIDKILAAKEKEIMEI